VGSTATEEQWAAWMRAALSGDEASYRCVLEALAPVLRQQARRGFARCGLNGDEAEDVVQETLLALHLKRHTWRTDSPLMPWVQAIARNKLIDALRRRGHRDVVSIELFQESLAAPPAEGEGATQRDVAQMLARLKEPQRTIVRAITLEGRTPRDLSGSLGLSEGAVRVALHRALRRLAELFREDAV
jgi:RNA polymerase sigma factor (sigma-70 family)